MRSLLALLFVPVSLAAAGMPTEIEVHVLSKGAKFIGSSMGGARVRIEDAETGALLAEGVTAGATGDSRWIMREAHRRGVALATEGTAVFRTTLELEAPRRLRVTASGPLRPEGSANTASSTQVVLPGRHVSGGDGWVLEIPGLVVQITAAEQRGEELRVRASVSMMCGCPLTPGGLWDADRVMVGAILQRDGMPVAETELHYAGEPSRFESQLPLDVAGPHELIVYGYDPDDGNSGLARRHLRIGD